ncbi:MAG: hypothetical protein CME65_06140 [Halobacteriovoraceae bacterium]|nr:hypothetical protein [Halobacteriovoraceae bacterium]|tara:strand:+ start:2278 stop:3657 length:1380 start_codon:yes stop_codon:yes gene_type:complete
MRFTYFVLLILVSCGSVTKRDDFIRIDSKPRGYQVRLNNKKHGVTPTLIPRPDQRNNTLQIADKNFKLECHIDWYKTIVPNGIITALYGATGIYFFGYDYFSDSLYKCPSQITKKIKTDLVRAPYARVAFLPLRSRGNLKRAKFLTIVEKIVSKAKSIDSFKIISYEETFPVFLSNGLGYEKEWSIKSANPNVLNRVIQKFNITHFIDISFQKDRAKIQVFDAFTKKVVRQKSIEIPKTLIENNDLYRITKRSFNLIPNAISFSQSFNGIQNTEREYNGKYLQNEPHPNSAKGTLAYLSFDSVISPLYYAPYDADLFFAPSGQFSAFRSKVSEFEGFDLIERDRVDITAGFFTMDLVIAGITPILTPSLRLGIGYSGMLIEKQSAEDNTVFKPVTKVEIDFTSFVSDRWYINIAATTFRFADEGYDIDGEFYDSVSTISAGIGYYFPETYHWVDRIFGF